MPSPLIDPNIPKQFGEFFSHWISAHVSQRSIDFSFSKEGDGPFTREQSLFLKSQWNVVPSQCVNVAQVHDNNVLKVEGPLSDLPEADGLITNVKNLALCVRTADCLPIFLVDPVEEVIGLVHAGWRGTHGQIAGVAIGKMVREYGSDPFNVKVAFGPAIGGEVYEVGAEFLEHFEESTTKKDGKIYFDLVGENRRQLFNAGIDPENLLDTSECTFSNDQYFSYRREGEASGRTLSMLLMHPHYDHRS